MKKNKYICERCNKKFDRLDENGNYRPQKIFLRPSVTVKVGGDAVAVLPRLCHKCYDDIKGDIIKYLNTQVA